MDAPYYDGGGSRGGTSWPSDLCFGYATKLPADWRLTHRRDSP